MGQHRPRVNAKLEKFKPYILGALVVAFMLTVGWLVIDAEASSSGYEVQMTEQESTYIYELEQSTNLDLTPQEILVALDIADKHIAHGHLNGMRIPMQQDFERGIPRIPDEKLVDAVQVLEHHFKNVTGLDQ